MHNDLWSPLSPDLVLASAQKLTDAELFGLHEARRERKKWEKDVARGAMRQTVEYWHHYWQGLSKRKQEAEGFRKQTRTAVRRAFSLEYFGAPAAVQDAVLAVYWHDMVETHTFEQTHYDTLVAAWERIMGTELTRYEPLQTEGATNV